jgi:hypothetical protein
LFAVVSLNGFRWKKIKRVDVHPRDRPKDGSFESVGGFDIARLEYEVGQATKLLYFREEAGELWDALDNLLSKPFEVAALNVEGSPGVGKSCEVWAWISSQYSKHCWKQALQNYRTFALWIGLLPGSLPARVVMFTEGFLYWSNMMPCDIESLLKSDIAPRFIILDGWQSLLDPVSASLRGYAFLKRDDDPSCQTITVTSMSVKRNPTIENIVKIAVREVGPWSLEQYRAACSHSPFFDSIKCKLSDGVGAATNEELIERKFHYAGGSARWMFSVTQKELVDIIAVHIARVPNVHSLFSGVVGENSAGSINHLMCRYKEGSTYRVFMTSKFVASQLMSQCESSVYKVVYALASHQANPAFLGWIVEIDLISQMRQCSIQRKKFEFVHVHGTADSDRNTWSVPQIVDFDPDSNFNASDMTQGSWLKPVKWNQEAYDLVGLFRDSQDTNFYLRFVQITNADEHTANLQVFQQLAAKAARALGCEVGVEIFVVSPAIRAASPTKIKIKNNRALESFSIGSTDTKWKGDEIEKAIHFLFFNQQ